MFKIGSSERILQTFAMSKKACLGEGGELECTLDDMIGTGSTVRSCCESDFRKTFPSWPSCKKIKMFGQRVASLLIVTCKPTKILLSAK